MEAATFFLYDKIFIGSLRAQQKISDSCFFVPIFEEKLDQ